MIHYMLDLVHLIVWNIVVFFIEASLCLGDGWGISLLSTTFNIQNEWGYHSNQMKMVMYFRIYNNFGQRG